MIRILVELITGIAMSTEFDSFATIFGISNSLANPIIMLYLDGKVNAAVSD